MPELKIKTVDRTDGLKEAFYLPAIWGGLKLTVSHLFSNLFGNRRTVTYQYPEQQRPVSQRWRGRHRLTRKDSGFLNCTACYMCETVCPAQCIHIEAGDHPDLSIEKYPVTFDIDELRCVFCGLCVEVCPKEAIRMDTGIVAMSYSSRNRFEFTRDLLKDSYKPNLKTKYVDIPAPRSIEEALPNSHGIPALDQTSN